MSGSPPPWQSATAKARLCFMDTVNPAPGESADTSHPETEVERRRRLAWEAERIAEADASIDAGYYATSDEVDAWIDSLGTDNPLPVPYPRRPRPL
jgi:hypothetical protein